jgi:hypothetical protein
MSKTAKFGQKSQGILGVKENISLLLDSIKYRNNNILTHPKDIDKEIHA